jgi:cell division protease FtsH
LPDADPVRKITILPRGMALGITWQLPSEDKHLRQKKELIAEITTSMGGRSAEEIVFNEISTGAANDIKVATDIARDMVCRFGMSEVLGPLTFGKKHEQVFLGRDIMEDRNYSENVAAVIDREIRGLVENCYKQAKGMLSTHREFLDEIAKVLLDKEVLEGEELDRIFNEWQISNGHKPANLQEPPGEVEHETQII